MVTLPASIPEGLSSDHFGLTRRVGRWCDVGEERAVGYQRENHRTPWGCAHFRRLLESRGIELSGTKLLVVGSGDGSEAAYFATRGAAVSALDPSPEASDLNDLGLEFHRAPLEDNPFRERLFDLVFCYHVLEHMQDPKLALMLMHDSLAPGGLLYLGTPNRSRALGYLGSRDATAAQKVRWNLADWRGRLVGRFRNELGAHAGFSRQELLQMALECFETVEDVTLDYIHLKYVAAPPLAVKVLTLHPAVFDRVSPAVYVLCQKRRCGGSG